jgi:hypothetical protein
LRGEITETTPLCVQQESEHVADRKEERVINHGNLPQIIGKVKP